MSTLTKTPSKTEILRAIAQHWAEFSDWPIPQDITGQLGPIHGLMSILAQLKANNIVELHHEGTTRKIELLLSHEKEFWHHSHENLTELGDWLVSELEYDAKQLQEFYLRPYRYGTEYAVYLTLSA